MVRISKQDKNYQALIVQSESTKATDTQEVCSPPTTPTTPTHLVSAAKETASTLPPPTPQPVFTTASIVTLIATVILQITWIAILIVVLCRWHGWSKASTRDQILIIFGPITIALCAVSELFSYLTWRTKRKGSQPSHSMA